jgi:mRNA-degrading endonuclease RelE of RelBE toxin-antitoxin system
MIYSIEYSKAADRTLKKWKKSNDRIIYDIYDDRISVLIIQAEEHYNDK